MYVGTHVPLLLAGPTPMIFDSTVGACRPDKERSLRGSLLVARIPLPPRDLCLHLLEEHYVDERLPLRLVPNWLAILVASENLPYQVAIHEKVADVLVTECAPLWAAEPQFIQCLTYALV